MHYYLELLIICIRLKVYWIYERVEITTSNEGISHTLMFVVDFHGINISHYNILVMIPSLICIQGRVKYLKYRPRMSSSFPQLYDIHIVHISILLA